MDSDFQLLYTFDGVNYVATGITVPQNAGKPTIEIDGDLIKITVGEQSFMLEKPEEIVFEIKAGKVNFNGEETMTIKVVTSGIDDVSVIEYPKGWYAAATSNNKIEITAPALDATQTSYDGMYNEVPPTAAATGYVKVHACGADGKCMVGKIAVGVGYSPLAIKVLGSNVVISGSGFYGISTEETLESDAKPLLDAASVMSTSDWGSPEYEAASQLLYSGKLCQGEVTTTLAELLGSEPVVGKEYIVWAFEYASYLMPGQAKPDYSFSGLVKTYAVPYEIKVTEDETKRTAFNIDITVTPNGIDEYIALALPGDNITDSTADDEDRYTNEMIEYYQELMVEGYKQGQTFGKLMDQAYTGSLLDICEGTSYYMGERYSPDQIAAIIILPIDGRSASDYTVEDALDFRFRTSPLTVGGEINAIITNASEAVQSPYTQVAKNVTVNSDEWAYFYFSWISADKYTALGGDNATDADLAAMLLEKHGMTPSDVTLPCDLTNGDCKPGSTYYLVAMFVDNNGKYGDISIVEAKTESIEYSETLSVNIESSNLITEDEESVLKNVQKLELKLSGGATKYKYVTVCTTFYNQYENSSAVDMASTIALSTSAKEVTPDTDGKITIDEHQYNQSYYLALLGYDADGKPAKEALIVEYDCKFAIDNLISDENSLKHTPDVQITYPTDLTTKENASSLDYCYYSYTSYDALNYVYKLGWSVTPAVDTEVKIVLVSKDSYSDLATLSASEKASKLWLGGYILSYYGKTLNSTETVTVTRSLNLKSDHDNVPALIMATWKDSEGNFYYKEWEVDLTSLKSQLDNAQ